MALLVDRFKRPRTLAVIGVVVVLIVLNYLGALRPVERVTNTIIRPFQIVAAAITSTVERLSAPFSSTMALYEQKQQLQRQYNEVLAEMAQLRQSLALQEVLSEQVSYLTEREFTFVPAKVSGRTSDPSFDTIIVNIGETKGVVVGQAAVIDRGVFIGTVRSVEDQHAEILLINDNRSIINAAVENEAGTSGVVSGQFSKNLFMDLIPQGGAIKINDIIVTRADKSGIPGGLVIGKVVEVKNNPGQLFQSALVAQSAMIDTASIISIITGQQ